MHRYVAGVKRVVGSLPNNGPPGRPAPEPEHLFARATPPCGTTAGHIKSSSSSSSSSEILVRGHDVCRLCLSTNTKISRKKNTYCSNSYLHRTTEKKKKAAKPRKLQCLLPKHTHGLHGAA